MKVEVLVSCMTEDVHSLLLSLNLQTNAVIVNQCNKDSEKTIEIYSRRKEKLRIKIINTCERGLSRSRNMAIRNSSGDICLLCDDDEVMVDGYEKIILDAYKTNTKADVMLFDVQYEGTNKLLTVPAGKLSFRRILSAHSVQMSFNRQKIKESGVIFDNKMGAGSGNGGGEEIKFLLDLYKKRTRIYSSNNIIAKLSPSESSWFSGYNAVFFLNYGWSTRRWAGLILGYAYLWYYVVLHRNDYIKQCSTFSVIKNMHKGFFSKR